MNVVLISHPILYAVKDFFGNFCVWFEKEKITQDVQIMKRNQKQAETKWLKDRNLKKYKLKTNRFALKLTDFLKIPVLKHSGIMFRLFSYVCYTDFSSTLFPFHNELLKLF